MEEDDPVPCIFTDLIIIVIYSGAGALYMYIPTKKGVPP